MCSCINCVIPFVTGVKKCHLLDFNIIQSQCGLMWFNVAVIAIYKVCHNIKFFIVRGLKKTFLP